MDRTEMIKIKFGDTLKRMKLYYSVYGALQLRLTDLRKKILHTFKFPADADFILTYVDEDGDVVTLFDDVDLSDALTQSMEVLKINVQLCNKKLGADSYAQSDGSSISTQRLASVQTQHPYPKIETGVFAKVSKSVLQHELQEALLQLLELVNVDSYAQFGGSSISTQRLTSLQTPHPYRKIETGVFAKVSKSVLQQLREALLQLLEFLIKQYLNFYPTSCFEALSKIISKAVSGLDDLFDSISKMCMNLARKILGIILR